MHEKISRWVHNYTKWVTRACLKDLELLCGCFWRASWSSVLWYFSQYPLWSLADTDLGITYICIRHSNKISSVGLVHRWMHGIKDSTCKHVQIAFLEAKYGETNKFHGSRGVLYLPRTSVPRLQHGVMIICGMLCLQGWRWQKPSPFRG